MGKLLFIHNARLVDSKIDAMGTVVVENGKISKVLIEGTDQLPDYFSKKGDKALWNADVYDAKGLVLMPAFIDMHSHFRYPGQTHKEDLNTGCHAAAAGGYGTVVLMPNTTPVVSSVEDASLIRDKSAGFNCVDVLQTISITKDFDGKTVSHLNELTDNRLPKGCLEVPVVTEDGKDVADDETMLTTDAAGHGDPPHLPVVCPVLQRHEHGIRQEPCPMEQLPLVLFPMRILRRLLLPGRRRTGQIRRPVRQARDPCHGEALREPFRKQDTVLGFQPIGRPQAEQPQQR